MRKFIATFQKKRYLLWFIQQFKLKNPEAAQILNSLAKNPDMLRRIRLVENIQYLPDALLVSAQGAHTFPFLCRLKDIYYDDPKSILRQLRLDPPEHLYLWLSFDRSMFCAAHTQDFFYATSPNQLSKQLMTDLAQVAASYHEKNRNLQWLEAQINLALDKRDREAFRQLTTEYKSLKME